MSAQRVRLFVALDLPSAARQAVAGWCTAHTDGFPGTRPLAPGSLHATLCFLGGRDVSEVEAIAAACRVAGSWRRVELELGRPLWLPRRRPRVLATELIDEAGQLAAIHSGLATTLAAGGWYAAERRPFLAHVTAARIAKPGLSSPPELPSPPPMRFAGESVSLYRSHTGPAGARYEALATVRLAA